MIWQNQKLSNIPLGKNHPHPSKPLASNPFIFAETCLQSVTTYIHKASDCLSMLKKCRVDCSNMGTFRTKIKSEPHRVPRRKPWKTISAFFADLETHRFLAILFISMENIWSSAFPYVMQMFVVSTSFLSSRKKTKGFCYDFRRGTKCAPSQALIFRSYVRSTLSFCVLRSDSVFDRERFGNQPVIFHDIEGRSIYCRKSAEAQSKSDHANK